MTLTIYKKNGTWMFDDTSKNIKEEPFVGGFSELIDFVLKEYKVFNGAHRGIEIEFSREREDEEMIRIDRVEILTDDWARYQYKDMEGLLCPVTLQYFGEHPDFFYIKPNKLPFAMTFDIIKA